MTWLKWLKNWMSSCFPINFPQIQSKSPIWPTIQPLMPQQIPSPLDGPWIIILTTIVSLLILYQNQTERHIPCKYWVNSTWYARFLDRFYNLPVRSPHFLNMVGSSFLFGPDHAKMCHAICKQQRCRSDCAFAQSDQHLCCSLLRWYDMYTCYIQSFKILASFCSRAGWFECYLVENPRRHVFAWCGSFYNAAQLKYHTSDTQHDSPYSYSDKELTSPSSTL